MMAANSASLHFMTTLGFSSTSPFKKKWELAVPTRVTFLTLAGAGVLWLCRPIRCSRVAHRSPAHDVCAPHQNFRSRGFLQ